MEIYLPEPIKRKNFRRYLAKRYNILKRKILYLIDNKKYANLISHDVLSECIYEHKSFLLRQLRNVDMYLQINKITNLKLAFSKINGIIIKPGETFSFWKLVGKPTKKKGYLEGLILRDGEIMKGIGGGLCQLSNLIYWIILHSPLEITERWRHSYDVFPDVNRNIPFAAGATLSYNYVDLQFYNPTNQKFQLNIWLSEEYLHGSLNAEQPLKCKYEVYESEHRIMQQLWGGYTRHNRIMRKTIFDNNEIIEEHISDNFAIMLYSPMLTE